MIGVKNKRTSVLLSIAGVILAMIVSLTVPVSAASVSNSLKSDPFAAKAGGASIIVPLTTTTAYNSTLSMSASTVEYGGATRSYSGNNMALSMNLGVSGSYSSSAFLRVYLYKNGTRLGYQDFAYGEADIKQVGYWSNVGSGNFSFYFIKEGTATDQHNVYIWSNNVRMWSYNE